MSRVETGTAPAELLVVRRRFASHLNGEGIEIGPGHVPFPVTPGVTVRYLDRWEPIMNSSLFAELGDAPGFPEPDILADLDEDRLTAVPEASQDFVIASHVLEHLANPLAILVDIHRVLRPRGLLLLLLPDRHMTFDRERERTRLAHLVDEYRRDVREVDDAHILDFLIGTRGQVGDERDTAMFTPDLMAGEIEMHRRRSVHAHVWDADEFAEVMDWAAVYLGVRWDVVDTMPPGGEGTFGNEFGWVLSRLGGPHNDHCISESLPLETKLTGTRQQTSQFAHDVGRDASSLVRV
jgi:SAM-dependent methyltransferase